MSTFASTICCLMLLTLTACTGKQAPSSAANPGNDSASGPIAPAPTDVVSEAQDILVQAPPDIDEPGGLPDATTATGDASDVAAVTAGDTPTTNPDATDTIVAPWTLPEICKDDGIGPGPEPGAPCSVEGEMKCIDKDAELQKTMNEAPLIHLFCGRPYFVACKKDGSGDLHWQQDACALASNGWKKACWTLPQNNLQARTCEVYKGVPRCCPYYFKGAGYTTPCADSEYGTTLCPYLKGKQYGAAKRVCTTSEEVVLEEGEELGGGHTLDALDKCKADSAGCMYWFGIGRKSPDNLACWDPKKPYHEDGSHWIYPERGCIVKDGKVVWAQSCVEMGYWEYGGPGKP